MSRPYKALDLFCCAGGASTGLHLAGLDVVGVDIKPQPRYPFRFTQADALVFDLSGFDFIWASPPCQGGSQVTPKAHRAKYPNLIPQIRMRLIETGKPYVIENVAGMRHHLINPLMLCGSMFGLRSRRHRFFEVNFPLSDLLPSCDHTQPPLLVTTAGANSRAIRKPGEYKSVKNAPLAYGIDWMRAEELKEAIPPAYAQFLGFQVVNYLDRMKLAA